MKTRFGMLIDLLTSLEKDLNAEIRVWKSTNTDNALVIHIRRYIPEYDDKFYSESTHSSEFLHDAPEKMIFQFIERTWERQVEVYTKKGKDKKQ